jgi:hypothetical protein
MDESTQNITESLGNLDSAANAGGVNSVLLSFRNGSITLQRLP